MVKNHFRKALGISSIGGFIFSFYFLSANFTGNAIGNVDPASASAAGIIILFVSIFLAFLSVHE